MSDTPNLKNILFFDRNRRYKVDECYHQRFKLTVDRHEVLCADCDEKVDPYFALKVIATDASLYQGAFETLKANKKELENWKPHLKAVRELERIWRGKMLPCCPHCARGIEANDLTKSSIRKEFEEKRRELLKKDD